MSDPVVDQLVHSLVMEIVWDEKRCRVCGWGLDPEGKMCCPDDCSMRPQPKPRADAIPAYSEVRALAMSVVDKMLERWGNSVEISGCAHSPEDAVLWTVRFSNFTGMDDEESGYDFPKTICLAPLKALGKKVPA